MHQAARLLPVAELQLKLEPQVAEVAAIVFAFEDGITTEWTENVAANQNAVIIAMLGRKKSKFVPHSGIFNSEPHIWIP